MRKSGGTGAAIPVGTALVFLVLSMAAFAHPGHGGPLSNDELVSLAAVQIGRLVDEGKLESSWRVRSEFQRLERKEGEYMLVFANAAASDRDRGTLYVFLTANGEYVAANFSGR